MSLSKKDRLQIDIDNAKQQALTLQALTGSDIDNDWDFRPWIKENYWIRLRGGDLGPFDKWTTAQEALAKYIYECRCRKEPVFLMVPKTRQLGLSTVIEAIIAALCHRYAHRLGIVLSHLKDNTEIGVFSNVQYFWQYLSPAEKELRPVVRDKVTKSSFEYEHPHKSAMYTMAGTGEIGHALSPNYVHITEGGLIRNLNDVINGIMGAIPTEHTWDIIVIVEGTAKGKNAFFRRYEAAKKGKARPWKAMFFGLDQDDKAHIKLTKDEEEALARGENALDLNDEERLYQIEHNVPHTTMKWVHEHLAHFEGEWTPFNQEHPWTDVLAFQVSGAGVFTNPNPLVLDRVYKNAQPPVARGYLEWMDAKSPRVRFVEDKFGPLKVWAWPHQVADTQCVLGGDVGKGIGKDFTDLQIYTRDEPVLLCARFHSNRVQVDDTGIEAYKLAAWYGWAYLGMEETGGYGWAALRVLEDGVKSQPQMGKGYPFCYYHEEVDEITKKSTENLGWRTNRNSKAGGLARFSQAFQRYDVIIHDTDLLDEMEGYSWDAERRKWVQNHKNQSTGMWNDDGVMAGMIAYAMIDAYPDESFKGPTVVEG